MHKKLTVRLSSIVTLLLVCSMIFPLAGCSSVPESQTTATAGGDTTPEIQTPYPMNWQLHGAWILADGTTEAVSFTVNGHVYDTQDDIDSLDITIAFPDSFRYSANTPEPSYVSMNQKYNDLPHLMICPHFVYEKRTNSAVWSYFALDFEKQYMVMLVEGRPNCYLVASADPSVEHTALLKHFADFIESYDFNR